MAKVAGRKGFCGTSAAVTGINAWSLDYTADMLETTDFSAQGVGSFIPGAYRWSGTFSGYKDGAPQGLGVSAVVSLVLAETATVGERWSGTAYISGIHPSVNFDGIATYNYDFQGTASLTVAST